MEDLAVERGHRVPPGHQRGDVAVRAPDGREHLLPVVRQERARAARRRSEEGHEVCELDHVGPVGIVQVGPGVELLHHRAITLGTVLLGKQRAGDAHLVQVGVGGELQQGRIAVLPAELPHRGLPAGQIRHHRHRARDRGGIEPLQGGDGADLRVGDGVDQAQAEQGRGAPPRDHVRLRRHGLGEEVERLGGVRGRVPLLRPDAMILQERAAQRGEGIEGAVRVQLAEPRLQPPVAAADRRARAQVAGDARGLVEDGAQAIVDALEVLERIPALVEQLQLVGAETRQRVAEGDGGAKLRGAGAIDHLLGFLRSLLLGAGGQEDHACKSDPSGHGSLLFLRFANDALTRRLKHRQCHLSHGARAKHGTSDQWTDL